MAEEFGMEPAALLGVQEPRGSMARFRWNWDVYVALQGYKEAVRENQEQAQDGPGAADATEKTELVEQKDARAERRQEMEESGRRAEDPGAQLEALEDLKEENPYYEQE